MNYFPGPLTEMQRNLVIDNRLAMPVGLPADVVSSVIESYRRNNWILHTLDRIAKNSQARRFYSNMN